MKLTNKTSKVIGTPIDKVRSKRNQFYGSLKSWRDLEELKEVNIEGTDIDDGLEYLPPSLVHSSKREGYQVIKCSPYNINVGCRTIFGQLERYNFDLEAWQLAHPQLMFKSKPEVFLETETKEKWNKAVEDELEVIQNKIRELELFKDNIAQIEVSPKK